MPLTIVYYTLFLDYYFYTSLYAWVFRLEWRTSQFAVLDDTLLLPWYSLLLMSLHVAWPTHTDQVMLQAITSVISKLSYYFVVVSRRRRRDCKAKLKSMNEIFSFLALIFKNFVLPYYPVYLYIISLYVFMFYLLLTHQTKTVISTYSAFLWHTTDLFPGVQKNKEWIEKQDRIIIRLLIDAYLPGGLWRGKMNSWSLW